MFKYISPITLHILIRVGVFAVLAAIWDVMVPQLDLNTIYVGAISAVIALQTTYQYSNESNK